MEATPATSQRLFTGVALSDEALAYVTGVQEGLKRSLSGVRWVPEQNLHVTLNFLGRCEVGWVLALVESMREAAAALPLELVVRGAGGFPSHSSARVLWVGAEDISGGLAAVFKAVDRGAEKCGIQKEKRAYRPHVTIGRAKRPVSLPAEARGLDDEGVIMPVSEILLYESELTSAGAVYTVLERVASHTQQEKG